MSGITVPTLELEGFTIVLVGSFNPAIFHPLWFANNGLLPEVEAQAAKSHMVSPEITIFETEWFGIQVTQERFAIDTADPTKTGSFRDLVLGTFAILEHTPITAMGLNCDRHYRMASDADWHLVGDYYVPKSSWSELFDETPRVGMRSLTIQGNRAVSGASRIYIKLEPSVKFQPGVYIGINQHYKLVEDEAGPEVNGLLQLFSILKEPWTEFLSYREKVSTRIFSDAKKPD